MNYFFPKATFNYKQIHPSILLRFITIILNPKATSSYSFHTYLFHRFPSHSHPSSLYHPKNNHPSGHPSGHPSKLPSKPLAVERVPDLEEAEHSTRASQPASLFMLPFATHADTAVHAAVDVKCETECLSCLPP